MQSACLPSFATQPARTGFAPRAPTFWNIFPPRRAFSSLRSRKTALQAPITILGIARLCCFVTLQTVTRNTLHVLEKFKRTDIPVAKGADKPMGKSMPNASFIHQKNGMGGYIPPETVKTKPIDKQKL